ncbi:hypothetical protein E4U11_007441, partial [Claviceps purpurea]
TLASAIEDWRAVVAIVGSGSSGSDGLITTCNAWLRCSPVNLPNRPLRAGDSRDVLYGLWRAHNRWQLAAFRGIETQHIHLQVCLIAVHDM